MEGFLTTIGAKLLTECGWFALAMGLFAVTSTFHLARARAGWEKDRAAIEARAEKERLRFLEMISDRDEIASDLVAVREKMNGMSMLVQSLLGQR